MQTRAIALLSILAASSIVHTQAVDARPQGQPPAVETPSGGSAVTVYVYRYKQFTGGGLEPSVYCDDRELARMDNGRYFKVRLEPGTHVFRSNDKQAGISLDVKTGEEYYIRVEIASGFVKGHGRLVLTAREQGQYEIQKLKPLGVDKVKDRERVIVDHEAAEKSED